MHQVESFKEWIDSLRQDVEIVKAVVEAPELAAEARRQAACALNYLVTRMDLVPDWEEALGVLDDAFVLRTCLELASSHELDGVAPSLQVQLARLINEAERVRQFLGEDLYAGLRSHCKRLADTVVRGRTPQLVVDSAEQRQRLYAELDEELARVPAASFADPAALELRFKSYLQHKLLS
jgi:uncharacterized membrane protein YkvA (DUF1232 family)